MTAAEVASARGWRVRGVVQGVGFRPFVYRLATSLGLDGAVRNAGGTVVVTAAGPAGALEEFAARLVSDAPPHAVVVGLEAVAVPAGSVRAGGFHVLDSLVDPGAERLLPPDLATCGDCLAELFDPADRRYRYPFLNCTRCGPRATIVDDLPYDRGNTAMAGFPLCPACAAEYADPADRRFHAEPIACPACGPRLAWTQGQGGTAASGAEALRRAVATLAGGGLVAVKGIGGYQLVCDAADEAAVERVRAAKHRWGKALAVMVPDLAAARRLAMLGEAGVAALTSPAGPIVLARARSDGPLAAAVHPGLPEVGLFLPYSPLHHLLLRDLARLLVVTSGNRSGEPLITDDETARQVLGPLCDGVLGHDRPVRARYDDSVVRVVAGRPRPVRRARGYAPAPLPRPVPARQPILAVGAQLKNACAVAVGGRAVLGPHLGDLENAETLAGFEQAIGTLCRVHRVSPEAVAHDLHPGYLSTQYAKSLPARLIGVQHHHAHVAGVAAEHGITGPFVGVAYDGLGLGDDGTLWGGEVLLADLTGYRRVARFGTAALPGGQAAVRRPARMALGYLYGGEDTGGDALPAELAGRLLDRLDPAEVTVVRRMIARGVNSPRTSSAGRLFDAVAALLGLCDDNRYEGEAAVLLEAAADGHPGRTPLAARIVRRDGLWVYDPAPTLRDVLTAEEEPGEVAARFHTTLVGVTVELCARAAAEAGLGPVVRDPARSIVVRAVEIVYALDEALRLIGDYEPPDRPAVDVPPRAGTGHGATEAPRGLLYHRYRLDADGTVLAATIVPPTSQNQAAIEDDLVRLVTRRLAADPDLDDHTLTHDCERAIRHYDPCISCATHFLDLTVERR
ncbi:MAG: carbamoyltransferase HypF [Mycobacteriales bacterium]